MKNTHEKRVAYVFEDVGGWFVCDDAAGYLDTRGHGYATKSDALRSMRRELGRFAFLGLDRPDFTHYKTGGRKARKL